MRVQEIVLRTVQLPLIRPYVLSYRTFTEFEPIIVEVRDGDGRVGWGEGHISPGSSSETRDGGWTFCREHAAAMIGKDSSETKAVVARDVAASKVAATALLTAIEMLEGHPLLTVDRDTRLPAAHPIQQFRARKHRAGSRAAPERGLSYLQNQGREVGGGRRASRQARPAGDCRPRDDAT